MDQRKQLIMYLTEGSRIILQTRDNISTIALKLQSQYTHYMNFVVTLRFILQINFTYGDYFNADLNNPNMISTANFES